MQCEINLGISLLSFPTKMSQNQFPLFTKFEVLNLCNNKDNQFAHVDNQSMITHAKNASRFNSCTEHVVWTS